MYAKTLVICPTCGREMLVDTEMLKHYAQGCDCGGTMQETGCEEYDEEYAREMNERSRYYPDDYDRYR